MGYHHENNVQGTGYKFLGKGAYGCVFAPALDCGPSVTGRIGSTPKSVRQKTSRAVGKVFKDDHDFEEEWDMLQKIAKIDPNHEWSLPVYKACKVHPSMQFANKCELLSERKLHYMQTMMKHGGVTLHQWLTDYNKSASERVMVDIFLRLARGYSAMCDHGYAHLDCKPTNILVNDKLKPYIIDFGITMRLSKVYDKSNAIFMSYGYPWYPPEYYVFYVLYFGVLKSSAGISEVVESCVSVVFDNGNRTIVPKSDPAYLHNLISTQNFIQSKMKVLSGSPGTVQKRLRRIFSEYVKKFDVFSLGLVLKMSLYAVGSKSAQLHQLGNQMIEANPEIRFGWPDVVKALTRLHTKIDAT